MSAPFYDEASATCINAVVGVSLFLLLFQAAACCSFTHSSPPSPHKARLILLQTAGVIKSALAEFTLANVSYSEEKAWM